MSETRKLAGTIDEKTAQSLHAGDQVLFTGTVYVARDAAHKRLARRWRGAAVSR